MESCLFLLVINNPIWGEKAFCLGLVRKSSHSSHCFGGSSVAPLCGLFTLQHGTVLSTWLHWDVCGLWAIGCTNLLWSLVVHSSCWPRTPRAQHEAFEEESIPLGDQGSIEGCDTGQALKYPRRQDSHRWWCVWRLHVYGLVAQLVRRWPFLQVCFGPAWCDLSYA